MAKIPARFNGYNVVPVAQKHAPNKFEGLLDLKDPAGKSLMLVPVGAFAGTAGAAKAAAAEKIDDIARIADGKISWNGGEDEEDEGDRDEE